MIKILITGENSYVGNNFIEWIDQFPGDYYITKISVKNEKWKLHDFSNYDVILHVAGIAHVSRNPKMKEIYYQVNRDLTIQIAEKAKRSGIKQFIFLSSIIVYGDQRKSLGRIDGNTIPEPIDFYGDSKLQAERSIQALETDSFKIAIIRPPMVYGRNSRGNYPKLSKLAKVTPLFPDYENKRSMIYIDNLCEFLRIVINKTNNGIYYPQNNQYVKTSELVAEISRIHGRRLKLVKIFNFSINALRYKVSIFNKLFGDLYYDQNLSKTNFNYNMYSLKESIIKTESD